MGYAPQGWRCAPEDREKIARFALALERNEESMGEGAAMSVTCQEFGFDWLTCLPDSGHPESKWWEILE